MNNNNQKTESSEKRNIQDIIALTPMQEGMLFDYLKSPSSSCYLEQLCLNISGNIDLIAIKKAWNIVVEQNEMLRAVFRWKRIKKPVQVILDKYEADVRFHDLSELHPGEQKKLIEKIKKEDKGETFDLRKPSFRITLCQTGERKGEMIISNHHILYDGWSNGIILKEFLTAYNKILNHQEIRVERKTRFKDFVGWLRSQEKSEGQNEFWKKYLSRVESESSRQKVDENNKIIKKRKEIENIERYKYRFPSRSIERVTAFAQKQKITLSTLLMGAWGLLLAELHEVEDIVFDTTVSGRSAKVKDIEHMVGMFINTLPFRVLFRPDEKVTDFLHRLEKETHNRDQYENTPLGFVNEFLEEFRVYNEPLFSSVLILENYPLEKQLLQESGKLTIDSYDMSGMTHYDLTMIITLFEGIILEITYNGDIFDQQLITFIVRLFVLILERLVDEPYGVLGDCKVLSKVELQDIEKHFSSVRASVYLEENVFVAPRTVLEERLIRIWSEVLKQDRSRIGIDSNFFDFGGHSLKASLLVSRIQSELNIKIPLEEIFKRPTIRHLSEYINSVSKELSGTDESIPFAEEREYYALSSVQQRMVSLQQLDPASTAYNVSTMVEIQGVFNRENLDYLQRAFRNLVNHHECLRSAFPMLEGHPVQRIHSDVIFNINYQSVAAKGTIQESDFSLGSHENAISQLPHQVSDIIMDFIRPFDLARPSLMRAELIKVTDSFHFLVLDLHHIITDGFSMDLFIRDLTTLYNGKELPAVGKQYKDFCQWQYSHLQSERVKNSESFWVELFSGEIPVLNLLTDTPRQAVQSFVGDRIYFTIERDLSRRLRQLIRETGSTLFMVLLSALNILLFRYTGQEDIVVGTTVAGRNHPDLESIMGVFIETLALRNFPEANKSFKAFLNEVKTMTLAAYSNQNYPFRELIKRIGGEIDMGHNPLFNVMLIVQNVEIAQLKAEGLKFVPYPIYSEVSKVDITWEAEEVGDEIRCHLEYCTGLFERETIERFKGHLINILEEITASPGQKLSEIDFLSAGEKKKVLGEFIERHWRPDENSLPKNLRIEQIFEEQVASTPDHIALVAGQTRHAYLTYKELNEKAELLAKRIEEL